MNKSSFPAVNIVYWKQTKKFRLYKYKANKLIFFWILEQKFFLFGDYIQDKYL